MNLLLIARENRQKKQTETSDYRLAPMGGWLGTWHSCCCCHGGFATRWTLGVLGHFGCCDGRQVAGLRCVVVVVVVVVVVYRVCGWGCCCRGGLCGCCCGCGCGGCCWGCCGCRGGAVAQLENVGGGVGLAGRQALVHLVQGFGLLERDLLLVEGVRADYYFG